jgi:hypothetical protein
LDDRLVQGFINISCKLNPQLSGFFQTWFSISDKCPTGLKSEIWKVIGEGEKKRGRPRSK